MLELAEVRSSLWRLLVRLPQGLTGLLLRGDGLTLCGDLSLRGELWRLLPMLQWSGHVEIDLNFLVATVEESSSLST